MMRKSMKSLSEGLLDVKYPFKLRLNLYSASLVFVFSQEMISVAQKDFFKYCDTHTKNYWQKNYFRVTLLKEKQALGEQHPFYVENNVVQGNTE